MKNENNGVPNLINLIQHLLIVKFYDDCVAEQFEKPTLDLIDNIVFFSYKSVATLENDSWWMVVVDYTSPLFFEIITNTNAH